MEHCLSCLAFTIAHSSHPYVELPGVVTRTSLIHMATIPKIDYPSAVQTYLPVQPVCPHWSVFPCAIHTSCYYSTTSASPLPAAPVSATPCAASVTRDCSCTVCHFRRHRPTRCPSPQDGPSRSCHAVCQPAAGRARCPSAAAAGSRARLLSGRRRHKQIADSWPPGRRAPDKPRHDRHSAAPPTAGL